MEDLATLGASIFDCDDPELASPLWLTSLEAAQCAEADALGLLSRLSDELLLLLLRGLAAQSLASLAACCRPLSDVISRAVPHAVAALGLLHCPARRHGEGWPCVLRRAEVRIASRKTSSRLAAGHHVALSIMGGRLHAMCLDDCGAVQLWALPPPPLSLVPRAVRASAVACGALHSLVLLERRVLQLDVLDPAEGQSGCGKQWCVVEREGGPEEHIVSVGCGAFHSLLVGVCGGLWASGRNVHGQCGLGHFEEVRLDRPAAVAGVRPACALQVDGGGHHSLLLTHGGSVFAWGCGDGGRLGLAGDASWAAPQRVGLGEELACQVAAGGDDSYVLTEAGGVIHLGGAVVKRPSIGSPTPMPSLRRVVVTQISAGYDHAVALDSDGVVWSWGSCGQPAEGVRPWLQPAPVATNAGGEEAVGGALPITAHRIPAVSQLGASDAERGMSAGPVGLEAAVADALGRCDDVAAGGFFTVCWPRSCFLAAPASAGSGDGGHAGGMQPRRVSLAWAASV